MANSITRIGLIGVTALLLQACGQGMMTSNSVNMKDMKETREALRTIEVHSKMPTGVVDMGVVSFPRCHRDFTESEPTASDLIADLQITAYAIGADGIANITTSKENGLLKNCWYILKGEAQVFKYKSK